MRAERVRLKVNLIIAGNWFPMGSIVDKERIPLELRKLRYLEKVEEPEVAGTKPEQDEENL